MPLPEKSLPEFFFSTVSSLSLGLSLDRARTPLLVHILTCCVSLGKPVSL